MHFKKDQRSERKQKCLSIPEPLDASDITLRRRHGRVTVPVVSPSTSSISSQPNDNETVPENEIEQESGSDADITDDDDSIHLIYL